MKNLISMFRFNLIKSIDRNTYFIFVVFILLFMLLLSIMWFTSENNSLLLQMVPDGKPNNNVPMDPVRWWPSGVPQSMAVVGTMVGTFIALTKLGINPRFRLLGALGAGGVSTTQVIYNSAIENSVGFNRFMYSITEYKKTGKWPNIDQMNSYSEEAVNNNITKALEQADQAKIKSMVEEITKLMNEKGSSSNFVSSSNNGNSNLVSNFMDSILDRFSSFFTPSPVSGFLDDLIGQQIVLQFVILFASVSLLLLVIAYFINNLLLLNKDFIIKHLGKNKLVVFYLKYQVISIKISLFVLPLFIFLGLMTLIQSSYYMITHPVPYEILDVNLHVYVDSK